MPFPMTLSELWVADGYSCGESRDPARTSNATQLASLSDLPASPDPETDIRPAIAISRMDEATRRGIRISQRGVHRYREIWEGEATGSGMPWSSSGGRIAAGDAVRHRSPAGRC